MDSLSFWENLGELQESRAMFVLPLATFPARAFALTPADARILLNILINLQPTRFSLNSVLANALVHCVPSLGEASASPKADLLK